ncbi:MAG: hypothetical protein CMP23_05360 [Rickettsiales bacterium]|nr:hypothetical protein [Rickettsiales bacterium]|tara:strand:+ start:2245 stop:2535 length:291 start_codon:yes stop_codon:yes gene_type:complete
MPKTKHFRCPHCEAPVSFSEKLRALYKEQACSSCDSKYQAGGIFSSTIGIFTLGLVATVPARIFAIEFDVSSAEILFLFCFSGALAIAVATRLEKA